MNLKRTLARGVALSTLLLGLGGGCATELGDASVELGTGEWQFEPLARDAEQEVDLVYGVQGGWHIWLSFLADGFEPDVTMHLTLVTIDALDEELERDSSEVRIELESIDLDTDGAYRQRFLGWPGILSDPACSVDREMRIDLRVEDARGRVAEDERNIIPQPGRNPPAACP